MSEFVFDIEGNGLLEAVDKIWTMQFKQVGSDYWFKPDNDNDLRDFIRENRDSTFIGHNVFGYDLPVIEKVWGIRYTLDSWHGEPVKFADTLVMSQYYSPDLYGGHSLESWGEEGRLGVSKIKYRDHLIALGIMKGDEPNGHEFSFYHPDMELYCKTDVKLTEKLYLHLWPIF